MSLEILSTLGALRRIESEWLELELPTPMQSPAWLVSWWEAYGESDPASELAVLAVRDSDKRLIGLAPFYCYSNTVFGTALRFLGDGRASTDHTSLLVRSPESEPQVVKAVAQWIVDHAGHAWRRLRLEAVNTDDRAMVQLERLLAEAGIDTEWIADIGSFSVDMAAHGEHPTWDNYLGTLSKNRRKRLRRWDRDYFETGRAVVRLADSEAERRQLWPELVRLHRERREAMGYTGVFDEPLFAEFHQQASRRMLERGQLVLSLLELDGRPAAIDYAVRDPEQREARALYLYQGGIAPEALEQDAGHLCSMAMIRGQLEQGLTGLDLLRGDEPYKLSWGATHRPAATLHARPRDTVGTLERWIGSTYRQWRDRRASTEVLSH